MHESALTIGTCDFVIPPAPVRISIAPQEVVEKVYFNTKRAIMMLLLGILHLSTSVAALAESANSRLWQAAFSNNLQELSAALRDGAEIDARAEGDGPTALSITVVKRHRDAMMALLRAGANPIVEADNGMTAIHWAATIDNLDAIQVFADRGVSVNLPDANNRTPLVAASVQNKPSAIRLLIKLGADPDRTDGDGVTPLLFASGLGNKDAVEALLIGGANVNKKEPVQDFTPLIIAVVQDHPEIVQILLAHKANTAALAGGLSALDIARKKRSDSLIALLQGQSQPRSVTGPNVSFRADLDNSIVRQATRGDLAAVRQLLEIGANPNARSTPDGFTPLIGAVYSSNLNVVRLLLENHADPNLPMTKGKMPPLHLALSIGKSQIVPILIDSGANVNVRDEQGHTPLILAIIGGQYEPIRLLLDRGADVNLKGRDGLAPIWYANLKKDPQIVQLLRAAGAKTDAAQGGAKK